MPMRIPRGLLALCALLLTQLPAHAGSDSFADLLSRAKTQAAEGHRWAPPGNNMTETIMAMLDIVSTATPQQLAELSALLQRDKPAADRTAPPGESRIGEAAPQDRASVAPPISNPPTPAGAAQTMTPPAAAAPISPSTITETPTPPANAAPISPSTITETPTPPANAAPISPSTITDPNPTGQRRTH